MPKTAKRKGTKSRRATAKRSAPFLKVTSPRQFPQLKKMMNGCKIMFVYIGEPWCGFCNKFEPDFKEMVASKKRNMATVSILGSQLSASPLGSMVKADGYPTVAIVAPKQNASFNLPSRSPEVIRTVTENAPALTPPDEQEEEEPQSVMMNSLNNLLNKSRNGENQRPVNQAAAPVPAVNSVKLFEETVDSDIVREPSRFTPVTVDSNPPPLSEEEAEDEYLATKKKEPLATEQLGGGYRSLWDRLNRK